MPKINALSCVMKDWDSDEFDLKKLDPTAPSNIAKHVKNLHGTWKALNSKVVTSAQAGANAKLFFDRMERIGNIVGAAAYDKSFYYKMQSRVANNVFGDLLNRYKGNVNEYVRGMERHARGYILEQVSNLELANKAKQLANSLDAVYRKYNISNTDRATIAYTFTETASYPYLIQYSLGANPAAQNYLLRKQQGYLDFYKSLGLTDAEILDIADKAMDVVNTEYELALIATKMGANVEPLLAGLPALLSPQAKRLIETIAEQGGDAPKIFSLNSNPADWLAESRKHNILIPSDIDTLDYLFERAGIFQRINKSTNEELMQVVGGRKVTSVNDMMLSGNDPIIHQAFVNELTPDEFDFLVETGLLGKIPVDTPTLYETYVKNYQLPFDGINEVFLYNPEKAVQQYVNHLEKLASNSGTTWGLVRGAEELFGVPESIVKNSDEYSKFVPLSDALPAKFLKDISDPALRKRLDELYIHPKIADYYKNSLEITTNPVKMGMIGDAVYRMMRLSRSMMLGSVEWAGRQLFSNAVGVQALGADLSTYLGHSLNLGLGSVKAMLKGEVFNYANYLPDKKVYYGYSLRDIWKAGVRKGQINDWSVMGKATDFKTFSIKGSLQSLKELRFLQKNYPKLLLERGIDAGMSGLEALAGSTLHKYLAWANASMDNAAKLALAEQLMNPNRAIRQVGLGGIDVLPVLKTPEEAWDWVTKHWYQFDELPRGNTLYEGASLIQPFLGFMFKNTQLSLRYMLEHPNRFGSFLKLAMYAQDEFKEDNQMANYLKETPWNPDYKLTLPFRIPANLSGTGKDEFFEYSLSQFFTTFSTVDDVNSILDFMGVFNSSKLPSRRSDNPFVTQDNKITKLLEDAPIYYGNPVQNLLTGLEGITSLTEKAEKKRSLLGVNVSTATYNAITGFIPFSRTFNKVFQYTPLAGRAPDLNEQTGQYDPGAKSWAGQYPERTVRGQNPSPVPFGRVALDALGLAPNYIDQFYQMYGEIGRIDSIRKEARRELESYNYEVGRIAKIDPKDRTAEHEKLFKQYQDHVAWAYMIDLQWHIIQTWRKEQGLPSRSAIEHIKRENLAIDRLLPPERIQQEADKVYRKFNNDFINAYEEPYRP